MRRMSAKKRVVRTMDEFERFFYPKSHRTKDLDRTQDLGIVGAEMAEKSLRGIKAQFTRVVVKSGC